ncbi:hypothetical protein [Flavobacterium phycosphaerae]|uniref:hypothetical protein n=1 Tax=Flavobacterium phycosphaerae TaxID=2697515 RepID=UPI001389C88A|nr:hypothetical protein [Flavobacterium phycosphaerae]
MKKLFLLALIPFLFSCKEETKEVIPPTKRREIVATDPSSSYEIKKTLDSVLPFENLKTLRILDKVVITTVKKTVAKDSSETALLRFDFYNKIGIVQIVSAKLWTEGEGGEWYLSENALDTEKSGKKDNRFFELSYGFPACGYIHTHFLFFMDNNKLQLVTTYESMVDGEYGHWTQFEPQFSDDKLVSFTSVEVTVGADDSKPESDENLVRTFSDSIEYTFNAERWTAKRITPKGKEYRTEIKTFKELYPQE